VGTLHSKYEDDFRRVVPDALAHRLTRHAVGRFRLVDSVWAPNAGTLDTLRSYGYHGSVIVMPNGSDFGRPPADELAAMRRRGAEIIGRPPPSAGIDASDGDAAEIVLLYVGQMRWEKNVRVILEALGRLAGEHRLPRRVSMVFVGSGPDMDGIRSLSRKLSLAAESNPRVVYLGAIYDRDVLAALYARADVFVFPSVYDNAPLVIREAAAFGTPSVLAAGSNSARDTADGHSAFHVQPNAEALAATLAGLVARPDRIAAVGRGAARDLYAGWQEVAARVAAHYRRIESL
jgi:glycosyltransferase involved in cell wall biosynthesis